MGDNFRKRGREGCRQAKKHRKRRKVTDQYITGGVALRMHWLTVKCLMLLQYSSTVGFCICSVFNLTDIHPNSRQKTSAC